MPVDVVSSPSPQAIGLFGGLLDRFTEIVGDGPSYATFHFASQQEGARLGANSGPAELPDLLRRVDAILGHRSRLVESGPELVRIEVDGSALLAGGRVGVGVLLGFLEGVLKAVFKHAVEGGVENQGPDRSHGLLLFAGKAA